MSAKFHPLEVAEVAPCGADAVAVRFRVPEALRDAYAFTPGQYLTLRATIDGEEVRRSYSIASAPGEDPMVGIKRVEGGRFSTFAQGLRPGDILDVMTPEGRFAWKGERDVLLIAAGSGITPMMAIAEAALGAGARVSLVYGNRNTASIMFRERLEALKDRHLGNFTLIHILSREEQDIPILHGRIEPDRIARLADAGAITPETAEGIFLCGPGQMIDALAEHFGKTGVPPGRIHHERFQPEGAAAVMPPSSRARAVAAEGVAVEVILDGARRSFTLEAGDASVVEAAARQGLELPYSCKGGMCCTCRCRIVEGSAEMAVNYALEPWELEAGFTLACQSRPTSDRLVLDFDAA